MRKMQKKYSMQYIKKNQGSSLVSVIVAFAILMIGLSLFATALYTADSMMKSAQQIKSNCTLAVEEFYQNGMEAGSSLDSGDAAGSSMKFEMNSKAETTGYASFSMYGEAKSWDWHPQEESGDETTDTFRIYYFQAP